MHAIKRGKSLWPIHGLACLAVLGLVACWHESATSPESRAVSISLESPAISLQALGAIHELSATVLDANGSAIPDLPITWSTLDGAIAEVDSLGRVKAVSNGETKVHAHMNALSAEINVKVKQVITQAVKVAGDSQSGQVAKPLVTPIEIELRDSLDHPFLGDSGKTQVVFAAQQGGKVSQDSVMTDAKGRAKTTWTLGNKPEENTLTANIEGPSMAAKTTLTFSATAFAGPPASIVKLAGDRQSGVVGKALADSIEIELRDSLGNVVSVVEGKTKVVFAAKQGGKVSTSTVAVDAKGKAKTSWTLGTKPEENHLTVSIEDPSGTSENAADFSATALVGPPAMLSKISGDNQADYTGEELEGTLRVKVEDAFGNPVPGVTVPFTPNAHSGSVHALSAVTDSTGEIGATWTLGQRGGIQSVDVGIDSLKPLTFTATAQFGDVVALDSTDLGEGPIQNQNGLVGQAVNLAPAVRLTGKHGKPLPGIDVLFSTAAGNGSVTGAKVKTDSMGVARLDTWTLGTTPGRNALTAKVDTPSVMGNPVQITANGMAPTFNIVIRFLDSLPATDSRRQAFLDAKAKWESIIIEDIPSSLVQLNAGQGCADPDFPALSENVDDVLIYVQFPALDGPGGTLGKAGPCLIRSNNGFPILGRMKFDIDDVNDLNTKGRLKETVLHEMGHVLGFGTLWKQNNQRSSLLTDPCPSPTDCKTDPAFNGTHAMAVYRELNPGDTAVSKGVPVEDCVGKPNCRDASLNAHWRDLVFGTELMTGFSNQGVANPLSRLSIASMWDMGYTVNYAAAEAYTFTPPIMALTATGSDAHEWNWGDDVLRIPILVVDEQGRIVKTIDP